MSRRVDADTSKNDDRIIDACPECMGRRIVRQSSGFPTHDPETPEADWRCHDCEHCFEEPHQRANVRGTPRGRGTIILAAADPDTPINELAERYGHIGPGGEDE